MPRLPRCAGLVCGSLFAASTCAVVGSVRAHGQGAPQTKSTHLAHSAPIADISYEVTADSETTAARSLAVAMHFRVAGPGPVVLALPAWSPGHYQLLWFARRVSSFSPTSAERPVNWHQLDFQTWELDGLKVGASVTVAFDYLADTIDRAVAWTRPDFAFFNGTNLFMYPVGHGFDWPAEVDIHIPMSWRVATGMTASAPRRTGGMHHDYNIVHVFTASNYHDLVDMPFFVGNFDLDSIAVSATPGGPKDHWVRAANYPAGLVTGERMTRWLSWLAKIAPVHAAVFHDMPWHTYTVLQVADAHPNGGGLEHQDSQLDEISPQWLDLPLLPGLYAHEMFHSWNVKRLRPADMVPYRYDDAEPTAWLWEAEGLTDYYGALAVVRSGVGDSAGFFASMAGAMTSVAAAPPTAVTDASLRTWINPTDGSGGLYYPKGSNIGFLLDILIRDASDNRHSLDDVMRSLYESTYKQGRGYTATDWWSAVSRAAAPGAPRIPFATVRGRFVEGRDPFPWDTLLPLAGLRIAQDTMHVVRLGVSTAPDSAGGVRVMYVAPHSAADTAGIKAGDLVTQLGDVTVRDQSSFDEFRRRYANASGTTISATVFRPTSGPSGTSQTLTVQVPIRSSLETTTRIEADPDASPKAERIRHGILTGTTSGA
jgi:predicted metalloprotease with PDZ domain